jgi:hypothetical protein
VKLYPEVRGCNTHMEHAHKFHIYAPAWAIKTLQESVHPADEGLATLMFEGTTEHTHDTPLPREAITEFANRMRVESRHLHAASDR